MTLLDQFRSAAIQRGLLSPGDGLPPARIFELVRDMPYQRATNRKAATTINEWRGTCSGKHYLLKELFQEIGLDAQVIACTTVTPIDPSNVPESNQAAYHAANRRFVDVHNYLLVGLPDQTTMIVDATFPLSAQKIGLIANERFVLGENQQIAFKPIEIFPVPEEEDPQAFKDRLLRSHFTRAELEFREIIIKALSERNI